MKKAEIFIAGLGHLGRAVLTLLEEPSAPEVRIRGLADSSGAVCFQEACSLAPPGTNGSSTLALGGSWAAALKEAKKSRLRLVDLDRDTLFGPGRTVFYGDVEEAIGASPVDFLLELSSSTTSTGGAASKHALTALNAGADVVFASKGALAADWDVIMGTAERTGQRVRYSATVGGGMPVLDAGRSFARANPIESIEAVLNGTSVFVLSLMEQGMDLNEAVKTAQEAGMAETDPSADLDGLDAAAKLCILARSVLGQRLGVQDVKRESLRSVSSSRLAAALASGTRLRAVATLRRGLGDKLQAHVQLTEVPLDSPLARTGSENAIMFHSRYSGTLSVIGKGAGPMETAPAVLRDLSLLLEARNS